MKSTWLCRVVCFCALLGLPVHAGVGHAAESMVFNTADDPPNATADHRGLVDLVMIEAFRRLAIPLTISYLPAERAMLNADAGIDDGSYSRVEGLEAIYPHLIRVPEPVTTFEFVAFGKGPDFRTDGWESLRPYNVGIITGWKILEKNIRETKSLTKVSSAAALFSLLERERADLVVYDRLQGMVLLRELAFDNIRILAPPLAVRKMYPYLHEKHASLVPELAATLREMKRDGTYKAIMDRVLQDFSIRQ